MTNTQFLVHTVKNNNIMTSLYCIFFVYSSTHSLKRLTMQQQHTGWVEKGLTTHDSCFRMKNTKVIVIVMLSSENILFLIKCNVNVQAWTF